MQPLSPCLPKSLLPHLSQLSIIVIIRYYVAELLQHPFFPSSFLPLRTEFLSFTWVRDHPKQRLQFPDSLTPRNGYVIKLWPTECEQPIKLCPSSLLPFSSVTDHEDETLGHETA